MTLRLIPSQGWAGEIVFPYSGSKRDCNPCGRSGWTCMVVDSRASILILSTCPRDRGLVSPRPHQSEKVTRVWRSLVGVLGQDHSTDLSLGRPLSRGLKPRLLPTGPDWSRPWTWIAWRKSRLRRAPVWSTRGLRPSGVLAGSGPTGDPGSLDLSEAPERLCNLFNREGAILTIPCFCSE
jgi:hypothetical protein